MNYFKQSLTLLLITGLMIGSAQAGIKVEVDCCNLVQPVMKGLTNAVDVLSRVHIPTISYVSSNNHTMTTVYKTLPAVAAGAYLTAASVFFAYAAYDCYTKSEGSFKEKARITTLAAISSAFAVGSGLYFFHPDAFAQTVTEYIG